MGCALTTQPEVVVSDDMEQKRILDENADLKQTLNNMQQEMEELKQENSRTRQQQVTSTTNNDEVYALQKQISHLKSQSKTPKIQNMKQKMVELKTDNIQKDIKIKHEENAVLIQNKSISTMKQKIDKLKQEQKEMENDEHLINFKQEHKENIYIEEETLLQFLPNKTFPVNVKVTDNPLFVQNWKPWTHPSTSEMISVGTMITVEEVKDEYVRISSPYKGWYSDRNFYQQKHSKLKLPLNLTYWQNVKISILMNFLQINENKTAISLLKESDWNIRDAIDKYYIDEHKIDIQYEEIWEWKDDDNNWKPYDSKQVKLIEHLKIGGIYLFTDSGQKYSFNKISDDFGEEINTKTKKIRQTRKVKVKNVRSDDIECIEIWEWENDDKTKWHQYNKEQMDHIGKLKIGDIYRFSVGQNTYNFYKISQEVGEQINLKTNYKRNARKMEIKKINGIRYPDFWSNEGCYYHDFDKNKLYYLHSEEISFEEDYIKPKLINIDLKSNIAKPIITAYNKSMNGRIHKIESVQNKYLWDKFCSIKKSLKKRIGDKRLNEKHLWYGTNNEMTKFIISQGFRKEYYPSQCPFGEGLYFTQYANQWNNNYLIYSKVLCGESYIGSNNIKLTNWPLKNDASGQLYDSLVDSINNPTIYVIHDDIRVYPMYIVHHKTN